MADDHSQRLFRSTDVPARGGQAKSPNAASGNDPLAELARLIGQGDPFGEYARGNARQQAAPAHQVPPLSAADWTSGEAGAGYVAPPEAPQAAEPSMTAYPYDETANQPRYYGAPQGHVEQDPYDPNNPQYEKNAQYEHDEQDYYDDVPPRRRTGVLVIAGIFALAIVGTAGAFGYRAIFGSSGSSSPPPVIKADTAPSKIIPAGQPKDASSKLITDRVNDRPLDEKLVSREEKPLAITDRSGGVPPNQVAATQGSGVVGSEPKKIRTIAIHPDGTVVANAASTAPAAPATPAAQPPAAAPVAPPLAIAPEPVRNPAPPPRAAAAAPAPEREAPRPAPAAARPAPMQRAASAPVPSNAPLSLNPNASAPRAAAPVRTASVTPTQLAPPAANAARTGAYAVQVSSQRSEAEAQAAFRGLQGKYPNQLGGRQVMIHKVDLGAKGTYYRALVGPFANAAEAGAVCTSLKAAGGQCLIQKN